MKSTRLIPVLIMQTIILFFACNKQSSEPEPQIITLDGRGGGVIAYSYQSISGTDNIKDIYAINADGTGNTKISNAQIGLDYIDWSSDTQRIVAVGYVADDTWSIYVFNADGSNLERITNTSNVWDINPSWSPDGSQIAFTRFYHTQNREEIWIMSADGNNQQFIGVEGSSVKWSPDSTRLIYHSSKNGNYNIYICNIDGTDEQQLTFAQEGEISPMYFPDGSQIAFTQVGDDFSHNIYIMNSDGTNLQLLTSGGAPKWSPDGLHIAFHLDGEVHFINTDGTNLHQVTNSPMGIKSINPDWKPN